jgi:hypothetical protein
MTPEEIAVMNGIQRLMLERLRPFHEHPDTTQEQFMEAATKLLDGLVADRYIASFSDIKVSERPDGSFHIKAKVTRQPWPIEFSVTP